MLKLDGSKTVVTVPASDSLTTLKPPMGLRTWFKPVSFTRADCQCLADMEATANIGAEGGKLGNYHCDVILDEFWVSNKALSKGERYRIFQREHLRALKAPLKEISPYVHPAKIIRW